ncbi:cytochrome c maturation protein CcmE [Pseudomonas putida]
MNPQRKKRLLLIVGLLVGVGVAVGFALSALQQNINLFYTPTQIANGEAPLDTRIRAAWAWWRKARCSVRPTRWTCVSW